MKINWAEINEKLPIRPDETDERKALFKKFDLTRNGLLSRFEIDRGVRDVLKIDAIYDARPVIERAFDMAKNSQNPTKSRGGHYVELSEFRFFLQSRNDRNDRRIELIEFVNARLEIEKWVGKIDNAEKQFKKIDVNGGGHILFNEFCDWLNTKNFHLEDDDDNILE